MKVRRLHLISWIGVVGIVLVSACTFLFVVCREPHLEGRSVISWIRDLSQGGSREHGAAVQLFQREGSKAVPGLVSAIDRRRSAFAAWLQRLPLFDAMPRRMKDWVNERTTLQDLDRIWAIRMCALIGREARGCQKPLQRALADDSASVRGAAARALAQIQANPSTELPLVAPLLSDPDPGARSQAAIALGIYGESARLMLARLKNLTNDPDRKVVFSAQLAAAMIETPERVTAMTNEVGEISFRLGR